MPREVEKPLNESNEKNRRRRRVCSERRPRRSTRRSDWCGERGRRGASARPRTNLSSANQQAGYSNSDSPVVRDVSGTTTPRWARKSTGTTRFSRRWAAETAVSARTPSLPAGFCRTSIRRFAPSSNPNRPSPIGTCTVPRTPNPARPTPRCSLALTEFHRTHLEHTRPTPRRSRTGSKTEDSELRGSSSRDPTGRYALNRTESIYLDRAELLLFALVVQPAFHVVSQLGTHLLVAASLIGNVFLASQRVVHVQPFLRPATPVRVRAFQAIVHGKRKRNRLGGRVCVGWKGSKLASLRIFSSDS